MMVKTIQDLPILFFYGPSAVGKTYLVDWLEENANLLHLDFDQRDVDGVDAEGLRAEWKQYDRTMHRNTEPLFRQIRHRASNDGKSGVVISLPSGFVPKLEQVIEDHENGAYTVVLNGTESLIKQSFVEREQTSPQHFRLEHWNRHSKYLEQGNHELAPYRFDVSPCPPANRMSIHVLRPVAMHAPDACHVTSGELSRIIWDSRLCLPACERKIPLWVQ